MAATASGPVEAALLACRDSGTALYRSLRRRHRNRLNTLAEMIAEASEASKDADSLAQAVLEMASMACAAIRDEMEISKEAPGMIGADYTKAVVFSDQTRASYEKAAKARRRASEVAMSRWEGVFTVYEMSPVQVNHLNSKTDGLNRLHAYNDALKRLRVSVVSAMDLHEQKAQLILVGAETVLGKLSVKQFSERKRISHQETDS